MKTHGLGTVSYRGIEKKEDWEDYLDLSRDFYRGDFAAASVSESHFSKTFQLLMEKSPFVKGYFLEGYGETVGYALLSFSYSNEAGGLVLWLEELFLSPQWRDQGLGRDFLSFLEEKWKGQIKKIRLEVAGNNSKALGFYAELGFLKVPYLQWEKILS